MARYDIPEEIVSILVYSPDQMSSKLLQRIKDQTQHSLAHTTINQTEWLNG